MPTGYTAKVQDGTIKDFSTFAMQCARAFGALISLRDEDTSCPVPEKLKADDYYRTAMIEAETEYYELENFTSDKQWKQMYQNEKQKVKEENTRYAKQRAEYKKRYYDMLYKVRDWVPPTPEHRGLKDFMIQQLEESIKFDCNHFELSELPPFDDWKKEKLNSTKENFYYHREKWNEEVKRTDEKNKWLADLRKSLK